MLALLIGFITDVLPCYGNDQETPDFEAQPSTSCTGN